MRNTKELFFGHQRIIENGQVSGKGGFTVAFRQIENGIEYAVARCHPNDNFVKKNGRVKAAGRLNSPRYVQKLILDTADLTPAQVSDIVIANIK